MPNELTWRGDALAVPQVTRITPANVQAGDTFSVTINRKTLTVTAAGSTQAALIADVVNKMAAAIGAYDNAIAEFSEIGAGKVVVSGVTTALALTGPTDGKPFTVTSSAADAGNFGLTISTVTAGAAGTNEKQRITLAGTPTGGTFALSFGGQTTGIIPFNASAATVDSALEGLSSIGAGNVTTTGSAGDWTVEFTGALAGTDVALIAGDGTLLTGAANVTVSTTTQGSPGTNEVQRITVATNLSSSANAIITLDGVGSLPFSHLASADIVQTAMEGMSNVGVGNVVVTSNKASTATQLSAIGDYWQIEFTGSLGGTDVNALTVDTTLEGVVGTTYTIAEQTKGSATPVNEVQVITVNNGPTAGTFTLTFQGQTTAGIAYNAAASAVQSALEALSNIAAGEAVVTGNAGGPYTLTFSGGTLAGTDVSEMTGSGALLTGSSVYAATTQAAVAGTNEVQQVAVDSEATGGMFTLTFNSETTAGIAYNATASAVQTALEGLTTPVAGDFSVTGAGPYLVEFKQNYTASNVAEMTGSGASLTGVGSQTFTTSVATSPTGPNWFNEADNWPTTGSSAANAPAANDTLIFKDSDIDCLHGLDNLSGATVAKISCLASYTGKIGLPTNTGEYFEYRNTELTLGATTINIGEGEGAGSSRIKINGEAVQTTVSVYNTGASDDDLPAFVWRGVHASNVVNVFRGSVGVALNATGDDASIAMLTVGFIDSQDTDAIVVLGEGVSQLTTVNKSGGSLTIGDTAVAAFTQEGGSAEINGAGAIATLTNHEGDILYNSTGTITTLTVSEEAAVDFTAKQIARTVTNCTIYSGATLTDSFKTVTWSNPIMLSNCSLEEVTLDVGTNITLQPVSV